MTDQCPCPCKASGGCGGAGPSAAMPDLEAPKEGQGSGGGMRHARQAGTAGVEPPDSVRGMRTEREALEARPPPLVAQTEGDSAGARLKPGRAPRTSPAAAPPADALAVPRKGERRESSAWPAGHDATLAKALETSPNEVRKRNPKRLSQNGYGLRQPARPYLLSGVLCLWLPTRRHCLFPLCYADR